MPTNLSMFQNAFMQPKSVAEYANDFGQIQNNALARTQSQMQIDAAKRATQQEDAYNQLAKGFGTDIQSNVNALRQGGLGARADTYLKAAQDAQEKAAKTSKDMAETEATKYKLQRTKYENGINVLVGSQTPQDAIARIKKGVTDGAWSMQEAQQKIGEIPQDPNQFQDWRQRELLGIVSAKDQIEHALSLQQLAETVRHNTTSEGIQRDQLGVAKGNLKLSRDRLTFDQNQPKGQIVQSDQGVVLVDQRTGKSTPVMAPDGTPLAPKLKDLPTSASSAIMSNAQNINKVQQAIDLLDGKNAGALKGDSNATGLKGYLPQPILNRMDPDGVDTRAMITDIGSLVLHDRSGAAVTASETPRLLPFIPLPTDDNATARKKLVRFKQIYEQEQQAYLDAYSKDQGYKTPKVPKPVPATTGSSPKVGTIEDGHRFKGGDPADRNNWEKVK